MTTTTATDDTKNNDDDDDDNDDNADCHAAAGWNDDKPKDRARGGDGSATATANGLGGMLWFAGWLFTLGFANLAWWKALLAICLWPYFLALALR